MKARIELVSLTLVGTRKNYEIKFRGGFNYISGHTATGKTSILEMIDYALGAKSHKSYIEIGTSCTHVELILFIGNTMYKIRRPLFDFKAAVIVEEWDENKEKFLFYNRYEIDSPRNAKSLSAFLLEKLSLAQITILGQAFSFRDLYKYCYLKQTQIDNEDILGEKSWEKDRKRKATFEIIFNTYDKELEELKRSLEEKKEEERELEIQIAGIQDFLKTIDIPDLNECGRKVSMIYSEIEEFKSQLSEIKRVNSLDSEMSMALRREIEQLKAELSQIMQAKADQQQYINKLRLLHNQYLSEVEKKQMAIDGYIAFNQYEFVFCPNCLRPISHSNPETCCVCGGEKASDDKCEIILIKKEISTIRRKVNELLKFIEIEEKKYEELDRKSKNIQEKLREGELELHHLSAGYVNPNMQQIEYCNYEIGKRNRLIFELEKEQRMFEEVDRYKQLLDDKGIAIKNLRENIKKLSETAVDKEKLIQQLSDTFEKVLKMFEFPKLSGAYIDEKTYLPFVRGRKYDDLGSLACVTLITVAYYLAILLVGSSDEFHHLNLLIIDSPRKNLGAQAAEGEDVEFRDERIFNATIKCLYEMVENQRDSIQMIVVNNGYPEFLPRECVIAEFDADSNTGLLPGLIDDAP